VRRRPIDPAPLVRATLGLGAALLVVIGAAGCGRYGPPIRQAPVSEEPAPAGERGEEGEEEDETDRRGPASHFEGPQPGIALARAGQRAGSRRSNGLG